MPMTDGEKRAYRRGYTAHRNGIWPITKPPVPPIELLSKLFVAARELRNAVDGELAKFDKDDEMAVYLYRYVDELDGAFAEINSWINDPLPPSKSQV